MYAYIHIYVICTFLLATKKIINVKDHRSKQQKKNVKKERREILEVRVSHHNIPPRHRHVFTMLAENQHEKFISWG